MSRQGVGRGCRRTGWQPAVQLPRGRDRRVLSISTGSSLLPPALCRTRGGQGSAARTPRRVGWCLQQPAPGGASQPSSCPQTSPKRGTEAGALLALPSCPDGRKSTNPAPWLCFSSTEQLIQPCISHRAALVAPGLGFNTTFTDGQEFGVGVRVDTGN